MTSEPDLVPDLVGDTELRRLHPLTPFVKSWFLVVAGGSYLASQLFETQLFSGAGPAEDDVPLPILAIALLVALPFVLLWGYLYWRFTRYGIVGNVLRVETGVLSRNVRQIAVDRLQAVDVVRPLVARITGLAELRLEVAGGGSSEAPLTYLSLAEANRLRAELLARAAGLSAETPEAPEQHVLRVPTGQLLLSSLLSGAAIGLVVFGGGLAIAVLVVGIEGIVLPFIPALFGTAIAAVRRFTTNYGFTLAESPDGLRIKKGLVDTRAQTVPPGRVQAVKISEPALWRIADLARIEINVAGYAAKNDQEAERTSVLLPVGRRSVVPWVVAHVLPDVDLTTLPLEPAPTRARWLRPVGWRHLRLAQTERVFATAKGWVSRELVIMPHAKPQSVRLTQGPLQRRLRLATVSLDTTRGPVAVHALHRAADDARAVLDHEVSLERTARAAARPDRWEHRPDPAAEGK